MSKYFGRATISVNGDIKDSKPGASIDIGGVTRESVVTDQRMGYTETPKPSRIECEIALKSGDSINAIRDLVATSVTFECDSGQRYLIRNAYTAETLTISGGAVKLVLVGEPAQEVRS